jgi:glycosyltransferase involved in cell wall biosynthesis
MVTDGPPAIVFLTPVRPASHGNGLAMRAGLFLEGMCRRHVVSVVVIPVFGTAASDDDFVSGLANSCVTLDLEGPADGRSWPTVLLGSPGGRHRANEIYPLPAICRRPSVEGREGLRGLTEVASLVHVMRSYLAPCLDFMFDDENRPPVTLDLDELDSGVQRQLGQRQEAERFERLERYYTPRVDHVYTASGEDARIVRDDYGARRVTAVPNAVRAPAAIEPVKQEYDLLFVGNLSYEPNIDAARWLCEEIRPLLGAVEIAIVGSHPGPDVLALAELPGVTVAGDVAEVTSWYVKSRITVAPLRIGGGTRTKIVEALAHGRPVVATRVGAAGLDVGERNGVLAAGTANEFAAACRRLLNDASAAARVAVAGRDQVMTLEQVAEEIDLLTRLAVEGRSGSARAKIS